MGKLHHFLIELSTHDTKMAGYYPFTFLFIFFFVCLSDNIVFIKIVMQ